MAITINVNEAPASPDVKTCVEAINQLSQAHQKTMELMGELIAKVELLEKWKISEGG